MLSSNIFIKHFIFYANSHFMLTEEPDMRKILAVSLTVCLLLCLCLPAQAEKKAATKPKLTIANEQAKLLVGDTLQIQVACTDDQLFLGELTYTLDKTKAATLDEKGNLTALAKGQVTVRVAAADHKLSARKVFTISDRPETIELKLSKEKIVAGKSGTVTAKVLPRSVTARDVIWSSSDPAIATISEKGKISTLAPGKVTFTATSAADPAISGSIELSVVRLASAVTLAPEKTVLLVGQTLQLQPGFEPADVTSNELKYTSSAPKYASVDETGLITALRAGKSTIRAKATDGSNKSAKMTVEVHQLVTGVRMKHPETRIGVGATATIDAILEPKDATNRNMTWESSDTSIATVSGTTNRVRVKAHAWGDATITGVTEDGGFTTSFVAHGGAYRHAIKVTQCILDGEGKPRLVFRNVSNLDMDVIRFQLTGTDVNGQAVNMSSAEDPQRLYGSYNEPVYAGENTRHGYFTFHKPTQFIGLQTVSVTITGFVTTDGFEYDIPEDDWEWHSSI